MFQILYLQGGLYPYLISKVDGFRSFIGAPETERFNLVLLGGECPLFNGLKHCCIEILFLSLRRSIRITILFSPIFCLSTHWCVFRHSGQKTCTNFNDGECDYYVYVTLDIIREGAHY